MLPETIHKPSYFLWAFLSFFGFIIFYILYKIILKPLICMQYYRRQGAECFFFPLIGQFQEAMDKVKNKFDAKHYIKIKSTTKPARYTCTNLGTDAYVVLYDPALIKEYYLNTENYVKDPVFLELMSDLLGKGLLTSEGAQWKAQRKILSNAFHFDFLKSILPTLQKTAHDNLAKLQQTSMKNVNIMDVYQDITGQVIGKIFFGEQLDQYNFDGKPLTLGLANLISEIGEVNISPMRHLLGTWFVQQGFIPKHRNLMQRAKKFRNLCRDIVAERKRNQQAHGPTQGTKDMLDLLLEYKGEEGKMSDDEIIDQFITFFLAGMDTTGHLITMATYYLHANPEIKEKVLNEVKKFYKKDITIDDINKLEYTTAVLKESLRMSTPVPGLIPRRAIKDHMLKDLKIHKGDLFNIEFFYSNFNADLFEKPFDFNPERWMNKDKSLEAYTFIPFSGGPRNCIGQHLSLIESRIILAEFLLMYDFTMREGYNLEMMFKFLYEPAEPILLNLTKKNE